MGAPDATEASREQMEACAAFGRPGPEHELLKQFEGTWKGHVKLLFEPSGDPQESTGVMKNTMVLGGKFLEQVYEDDTGMFSGRGYWGFNPAEGQWEGFWIDSMAPIFQIERGSYDAEAKRWEMLGEMTDPMCKSKMTKRSVITVTGPDSHLMEMYFANSDGTESKGMEIAYTRVT